MNKDEPSITSAADRDLVQRYVESASVPAFEALVSRHLNHVFCAALRRVNGDHALAKDVTQTVFIDFARKAGRIPPDMPPGGWLHRHSGFVASKMIDKERRRRAREQEAATMNTTQLTTGADPDWSATAPLLDAAMDKLPASDRNAIVLRFFEQKDFRSVGAELGMSDDSAQKKVSRAVDKLRKVLARRGVSSSGGALASLLLVKSVEAAPASLATQISSQSLARAAATSAGVGLREALLGLGAAARIKAATALVALVAVAGFAGTRIAGQRENPAAEHANRAAAAEKSPPAKVAAPVVGVPAGAPAGRPGPMGLEALVAAAAAELRGGRESVIATARALGFVSQLTAEQMPEALSIAAALNDAPARVLLTKYLLIHWTESEPREAMAWASSDASGMHRAEMQQGVLAAWAANDPTAVMGWNAKRADGVRNPPISEAVIATVFRTMAKKDPAKAFARLPSVASPNGRGQALRGILDTVQTDADRENIAALIAGIGPDDIRIQARRAMVEQWARRDAPAAAAFVEKAEPAWERTRMMDSLGFTWLQGDPASAAEWWVAHAPGADTLVKIINVWAQQDPNAAGIWLGGQTPGPASDAARMTFARQVADRDEESALRWAETVSDAQMRESTIDHVFANWRIRNPDEANAFLSNSGWPDERTTRLRDSTDTTQKTP